MGRFESFANGDLLGMGPTRISLTADDPVYYMKPEDACISAVSSEADGTGLVYLPPAAACAGRFYYIIAPTGATAGDISLMVRETGAELGTNGDMDADGDYLLLFCTGITFLTIVDGVA